MRYTPAQIDLSAKLMISLGVVSVVALTSLFSWSAFLSNKYPEVFDEDILNDTVSHIIRDARATARVTFTNGTRRSMPFAKARIGQTEVYLAKFVREDDIVIKKQFSDTIILIQGTKRCLFIADLTSK